MSLHRYSPTDECKVIRRHATDEWIVAFYHKGRFKMVYCEECTSYHSDRQDAIDTKKFQDMRIKKSKL